MYLFVDFVSSHIVSTGNYRVIDRSQRQTILNEIQFSYEGCSDETCQLEIGRLLSAKLIVIGSLGKLGEQYLSTTAHALHIPFSEKARQRQILPTPGHRKNLRIL
ncbi:MAG TPA: hypothetical protein DCO79_10730 [Spirochaeta sp.]|nr:hypothetical protein [Spirochaeta sp.]